MSGSSRRPVRRDPRTGTIDVAVVDARDPHAADEISYWLKSPVRVIRTSMASMDAALQGIDEEPGLGMHPLAPPMGSPPEPAPDFGWAGALAKKRPPGRTFPSR